MNIPISDLIYKDCIIKPLENYPEKPVNSLSNRILQTLQVEEVE